MWCCEGNGNRESSISDPWDRFLIAIVVRSVRWSCWVKAVRGVAGRTVLQDVHGGKSSDMAPLVSARFLDAETREKLVPSVKTAVSVDGTGHNLNLSILRSRVLRGMELAADEGRFSEQRKSLGPQNAGGS